MYEQLVNSLTLEDMYITQVFDYYRSCFINTEWCKVFVTNSSRIPNKHKSNEYIGLCNRTIGKIVPKARSLEGGAIRGGLQHCGLITNTGGELFRGCIVIPTFDNEGKILEAVGYRFGKRIRHGQSIIIKWDNPKTNTYFLDALSFAKEIANVKTNK